MNMKRIVVATGTVALALTVALPAVANLGLQGRVYCDIDDDQSITDGVDLRLDGVQIDVSGDLGFSNSTTTGGEGSAPGYYTMLLSLDVPQTYIVGLDESTIPGGGTVVQPGNVPEPVDHLGK